MTRRRLLLAVSLVFLVVLLRWLPGQGRRDDAGLPSAASAGPAAQVPPGSDGLHGVRRVDPELPIRVAPVPSIVVPGSPGAFEGRVVSAEHGTPVAGAVIDFSLGAVVTGTTSGADGSFRVVPPAPGRWRLAAVVAPGFLPFAPEWGHSPVLLDARPGAHVRNVTITLTPAITYAVSVVNGLGAPVADALVRVLGASAGESALVPLRERYRTSGAGEAAVVAPLDAVVEASAPGLGTGRAVIDFAARVSGRVRIRLGPEPLASRHVEIRGRVELPGGGPAPEALVVAWPRWPGRDAPSRQATSDARGEFVLEGLDPGTYEVVARSPGHAPARATVQAGAAPIVLALREGGRIVGRVVERATGKPVTPFTILVRRRASSLSSEPLQSLAVFDPDGRFELDGLPSERVWLLAAASDHAPAGPIAVEVPAPGAEPAQVELELSAGAAVWGIVRSRASGRPLERVEVEVEGDPAAAASTVPLRARVLTDVDGRFELRGVPSRPASLFFAAPGHHGRVLGVGAIAEGERRGPLDVELSPVAPGEQPQVELTGIGAVLTARGDTLRVQAVAPGGGAAEAGLAPGDELVRIDGRAVSGLDFESAVSLVRGPEGSTVTLQVRRGGDPAMEVRLVVPRRVIRG